LTNDVAEPHLLPSYPKKDTPHVTAQHYKLSAHSNFNHHPSNTYSLAKMLIARRFSITNFVIASSALAFQVFVLYPWHQKLDEDFETLKREHVKVLKDLREERESTLGEIRELLKQQGAKGWRK
jgi:hypothetical protein